MAWRALKKMRRNPEQFFDVTIQPLLFTAMFAYIFGGAISGNVHSYLPLLIPGIVLLYGVLGALLLWMIAATLEWSPLAATVVRAALSVR